MLPVVLAARSAEIQCIANLYDKNLSFELKFIIAIDSLDFNSFSLFRLSKIEDDATESSRL